MLLLVGLNRPASAQQSYLDPQPFGDEIPGLDTAAVGDWWKVSRRPLPPPRRFKNLEVPRDQTIGFALYTVHDGVLKLTAQLYPLFRGEPREVQLDFKQPDGTWHQRATAEVVYPGWSAHFRIEGWDDSRPVEYRVRHGENAQHVGLIRGNPRDQEVITVGVLSCNSNKDRGDRARMVANIRAQDPDLLFFAGDQSYDHKEHTAAWLAFGRQFADVLRDRPVITIPDDHDIGQGNLWGEGGIKADSPAGSSGGYFYPAAYVNMVERCQTWHLPDAIDPRPVARGIGVYFTSLRLGGVDFAIIEDRKFKSGPEGKIPQQGPRPDHIRNPDYDPESIDVPGLKLLGERQLRFLDAWGRDWEESEMKCVLSQTIWTGVAQVHGNRQNRLHADLDNNGWPQTPRDRAIELLRRCRAVHLCGDQHLASVVQYGVERFRDGPWAFCSPAIVNNYYSRWWIPENGPGKRPFRDVALPWTGDYRDGMGNFMTMRAYANPDAESNGSGYGIVHFNKVDRTITFECWPREADVTAGDQGQFPGWPVTVAQSENDGRPVVARLPELRWNAREMVVVEVRNVDTGETLYTLRTPRTDRFVPPVYAEGTYLVQVTRDNGETWQREFRTAEKNADAIELGF
jgi:hypothetical protein